MEDAIGGTSAATLGYILGGIKGAKEGYLAYRNYKNMAPTPKRKASNQLWTPQSKRTKQSKNPFRSSGKPRSLFKSSRRRSVMYQPVRGSDAVTAAGKTGTKVRRFGKKKVVKVSAGLRKKIQKVLDTDKVVGKYFHISYYQMTPGKPFSGAFDDQQSVEYFGQVTTNGLTGVAQQDNRLLFSPLWVIHSVARLMNPVGVTKNSGSVLNLKTVTDDNNAQTNNFYLQLKTGRVKVLKQSATYRIRNNSGRSVTLKIYCLQPKTIDLSRTVGWNPVDAWNSSMDLQDPSATFPGGSGENPTGVRLETLYATPKLCSQFKNLYKMDETIVQIDAGKEYNYKVDGPSMEYSYAKFWNDSVFYDKQKFTKQVMIVAYNDLVRTSLGTTGRYTDRSVNDANSIVIEQTSYIKFAIPDQVGLNLLNVIPTGGNVVLQSKRYCYGIDNYQGETQQGVVDYTGDENPQQEAQGNV